MLSFLNFKLICLETINDVPRKRKTCNFSFENLNKDKSERFCVVSVARCLHGLLYNVLLLLNGAEIGYGSRYQ